jgi:GNAT superfamily N-acetyltransferase
MTAAAEAGSPSAWQRLLGRLRHGLLMQEILEALAARGLVCLPYIVVTESVAGIAPPQPAGVSFRELGVADAAAMVAIDRRPKRVEDVQRSFASMRCFGAFLDASLLGFTWARTTTVPLVYGGGTLFELEADEAYLLDMYVDPRRRGLRVAPWLRVEVLRLLAAEGRTRCYSLSYLFNHSSRTFKARLGAREVEWRLALQVDVGAVPGIDVRLYRRGPALRTRFARRRQSAREFADAR